MKCRKVLILLARSEGFEPPTLRFEVCIILLNSFDAVGYCPPPAMGCRIAETIKGASIVAVDLLAPLVTFLGF